MNKKLFGKLLLLILIVLLSILLIYNKKVNALSGDYNKSDGDTLSAIGDWNKLKDDFVAKSGDLMSGNLNMGTKSVTNLANPSNDEDAVNLKSMNTAITDALAAIGGGSANIKNTIGDNLKMVCGSTPYGSTNWLNSVNSITLVIDTSMAGFVDDNVVYFVSLYGDSAMYKAVGYNGIYEPTSSSFRIYISNNDLTSPFSNVTARDTYKWYVRWCGVGK